MNRRERQAWDQLYAEAWTALVIMVGLYVWGLIAGWAHLPWA